MISEALVCKEMARVLDRLHCFLHVESLRPTTESTATLLAVYPDIYTFHQPIEFSVLSPSHTHSVKAFFPAPGRQCRCISRYQPVVYLDLASVAVHPALSPPEISRSL